MRRQTVINKFLTNVSDTDIIVACGQGICDEVNRHDRDSIVYLKDVEGLYSSIAMGIALSTPKNVYILINDVDIMRELSSMAQVSASRNANIFYVILHSGYDLDNGMGPTLFRETGNYKGMLFNMGFMVYDFTRYFSSTAKLKEMSNIMGTMQGPLVILIEVDKYKLNSIDKMPFSGDFISKRINTFINNTEVEDGV